MIYRVVIPPHIERKIAKLHPDLKQKIRATLDDLAQNPYQGKTLKEDLAGLYSYRVSRFRIIYSIHKRVLEVYTVAVGPRKMIYQSIY